MKLKITTKKFGNPLAKLIHANNRIDKLTTYVTLN